MLPVLTLLLPLLINSFTTQANPITLTKRLNNQLIVSGRDGSCLHPAAGTIGNGLAVTTIDCRAASGWDISPGSGSVILSGTGFALDAGSNPSNNGGVKLWQSYPGLYQQTWYLTEDNRIAITGGDQCLDQGTNGPQTYRCTPGNTNQIWYVVPRGGGNQPPPSSSTTPPPPPPPPTPTGVLPNFPRGTVYNDPANGSGGRRIHPYGRDDLCVIVQNSYAAVGSLLEINYCTPNDSPQAQFQLFDLVGARFSTPVRLTSQPNLCIDLGSNPSNGGVVKLWNCIDGLPQQQIFFPRGRENRLYSGQQCVDVALGGNGRLQTWQCYDGNNNQDFHQLYTF